MTAVFIRTAANYLTRPKIGNLMIFCENSRAVPNRLRYSPQRAFKSSAYLNGHTISNKRILSKQLDSSGGESWSIIAYNISDELHIENAAQLSEDFKEYDLVDLPGDLRQEAAIFSLKKDSGTKGATTTQQPLHDIFIFREGTIVFWGVSFDKQKRILDTMSALNINPTSKVLMQEEKEHLNYSLSQSIDKSRLNHDIVQLATGSASNQLYLDRFAFSHAIALSVKLAIWENMLDRYIESISWVTNNMKNGQKINLTRDQVFRKTGEIYEMKHRVNLSSDLLDLPDIYWDRHNQEVIFLSMISFLNIKRRTAVMNEKLNNCCELMNLLAGHMNDKHHVRLEWMIIVLIMVEVLFEVSRFV